MPVAAAGLADVLVLHAREPVGRGVEQQLLARAPRLLLLPAARVQFSADVRSSRGVRVPDAFELLDPEEPGTAALGWRRERRVVRTQLAVEARDLIAQRAPGSRVVDYERLEDGLFHDHRHPPIGAFGLKPQNTCVPSMPTRCTPTVLKTIDFAVAVPTPTGPPDAV